jgi:putative peptidoglycan lipid II flippase
LLRVSASFAVLSAAAYSLSLAKAVVVARYFGTTSRMDVFAIAILVPNLLGVLVAGSSASALIPALALAERHGPKERARTFRAYLVLTGAACVVICVLLALLADPTMAVLASRFDGARKLQAAGLLRWASPLLILNAIYAIGSAELLSRQKYNLVAMAPAVSSLASFGIIVLFKNSGVPVLVYSLLVGTALQALVVAGPAWSANPVCGPSSLWTPAVRNLVRGQVPLLIASAVGIANVSVDQAIAAFLPAGNVSALNYASTINTLVVQMVVMSATWVALPELAQLAAAGNIEILLARSRRYIAGITMVAAPAAALILVCGSVLIRIVFQHGDFNQQSTHLVFATWAGYTLGLVPFSIGIMAARLITVTNINYALVALGAVALPLNGALDYVLMKKWGCFGISLSTSMVYCVTSTVLYIILQRRIGTILNRPIWRVIIGSVLASTAAAGCLWALRSAIPNQWLGMVLGGLGFAAVLVSSYAGLGLLARTPSGVVFLPAWGFPQK